MKYNLKNRPHWSTKAQKEWFEGFEKELRELREKNDDSQDDWENGYWTAMTEILGED